MASLVCLNSSEKWQACQGQVANQVERLVAAKLVGEAKGTVHDAVLGKDDGILERPTADQPHGAERSDVALEAEGACARQQVAESVRTDHHLHFLLPDQRMREVDIAPDAKLFRRVDADAAVAFAYLQGFQHLEIAALSAQLAHARVLQHLHERLGGAVQNGNFDGIHIDENVVDPARVDGSKQMLGGGKQDTLLHQAGGIAYAGYVVPLGFDGEVVQIHAAKDDTSLGRSGNQPHTPTHARVETHTLGTGFSGYGCLEHSPTLDCSILLAKVYLCCALLSTRYELSSNLREADCGNSATIWPLPRVDLPKRFVKQRFLGFVFLSRRVANRCSGILLCATLRMGHESSGTHRRFVSIGFDLLLCGNRSRSPHDPG